MIGCYRNFVTNTNDMAMATHPKSEKVYGICFSGSKMAIIAMMMMKTSSASSSLDDDDDGPVDSPAEP